MIFPQTLLEIQNLIDDEVQESLHLDYKDSGAISKQDSKKAEIGKDVSAFANSDGGTLIYGVREDGHLPKEIKGVDHNTFKREWFDQIVRTNISPIVPDIQIVQIPVDSLTSVFVIKVPKSYRAPHQAKDKRYYRRFNFESVPMENYEVTDVRNRRQIIPPLVNFKATINPQLFVHLEVSNIGGETAKDISFKVPAEIEAWAEEQDVKAIKEGIRFLAPNERIVFMYAFANALLSTNYKYPSQFEVDVTYQHPSISQYITETFYIDLKSYFGSKPEKSDVYKQGEKIEKAINELTNEVKKLTANLSRLVQISGTTGLDLSVTTLRNLKHIIEKEEFEKINPEGIQYTMIMEILGVDFELAHRIEQFFWRDNKAEGIAEIEGITEEIIRKIKDMFILDDEIL